MTEENCVRCVFWGRADGNLCDQKPPQHCCFNMIYSQPSDMMIKTECSVSTVCVGVASSLSSTSRVGQAAQNNCNQP